MSKFNHYLRGVTHHQGRNAFTLIELLVVIAIITVLMALLLPAIQKVRAAADKLRCSNNLHQIGIAVHHYHNDYAALPPGGYYPAGMTGVAWSTQARLLPYLEQDNLQKLIDFSLPYSLQTHVSETKVPTYICPSDPNIRPRVDGAVTHFPINYLANMGTWMVFHPLNGTSDSGVFPPNNRSPYRGITLTSIQDGTSNTIGFSEGKAYTPYLRDGNNPNSAGVPAPIDPAVIASFGGSFKNDSGHTEWVDARVHQSGFTFTFTPNTKVNYVEGGVTYDSIDFNSSREGRTTTNYTYAAVTARSYHVQCVNGLLMDGSVRSISNGVTLTVWRAMGTRNGGEVAFLDD